MRIYLDGNTYELAAGTVVKRSPIAEWPDNVRLDGQQQRKDRRLISNWAINDWSGGLGCKEINVGSTINLMKFWDAENVDTRWSGLILSPAFQTCTIVPSRADLGLAIDFQNNVYFAETTYVDGTTSNLQGLTLSLIPTKLYKYTSPTVIGSYSNLGVISVYLKNDAGDKNIQCGSLCGLYSEPNKIIAALRCYQDSQSISTINVNSTSIFYFDNIGSRAGGNIMGSGPALVYIAPINPSMEITDKTGTLHFLWAEGNNMQMAIMDAGMTTIDRVASISSIIGTRIVPMITNGVDVYAQLSNGIYNFDNTPAVEINTKNAQEPNGAMELFLNRLYFKNRKSVIEYDGSDTISRGYDLGDGLIPEKYGEITAMCSSWKYNFAAVQGGTYTHILAMDRNLSWQYFARMPSPGLWVKKMFFSNSPDGIDKLWCIYHNYPNPGFFINPLSDPLAAATYSFVPTGQITMPLYGGDLPEESGAFYSTSIIGNGITPSNSITAQYYLNRLDVAVSTLGIIGTQIESLKFGSPYGIEGYKLAPSFILSSSNTGTTPVFKQAVIQYIKDPDIREQFDFTIDLNLTADNEVKSKESVLGSLSYELGKRTLMPFWYGNIGTRHVKVIDMPGEEDVIDQRILEGEREGQIRIVLGEIV